ncbi:MAG: hypothetical protein K8J09_17205 [Planctomycetes bacterium]|nr:hypothetical protein [Planctomycetota bacterium]MCC7397577.1 hypothetical protein [Planctomycetota bacterium]
MNLCVAGWPILIACVAVACATTEGRFNAQESAHRAVLARRYPPGSQWRAPRDALGDFADWIVADPAPGGFAALALDRARAQHDDVSLCKYGDVPRLTLGSSLGAIGICEDYIFLDSQGCVLVAFRRFID